MIYRVTLNGTEFETDCLVALVNHLTSVLSDIELLNPQELAASLATHIEIRCDMIAVILGGECLTIGKTHG